ncbi:Uncharacterized protein QTN25_005715 [Entamoeba marina]
MAETPPPLMGVSKDAYLSALSFEPTVGYDERDNVKSRTTIKALFVLNIFFPVLYIYIHIMYSKADDPLLRKWSKWCQNVFALEACILAAILIILFSWWWHDFFEDV